MPSINNPAKSLEEVKSSSEKWDADIATGVFILGANELSPGFWHDTKAFRDAQPIARFGNLFVFDGTFDIRPLRAQGLAYRAMFQIFGPEPNIEKAIQLPEESAELDPRAFFVSLEIGNQYLKLGKREQALAAYQSSLENVPQGDVETSTMLADQIERIKTGELKDISPLRNPSLE